MDLSDTLNISDSDWKTLVGLKDSISQLFHVDIVLLSDKERFASIHSHGFFNGGSRSRPTNDDFKFESEPTFGEEKRYETKECLSFKESDEKEKKSDPSPQVQDEEKNQFEIDNKKQDKSVSETNMGNTREQHHVVLFKTHFSGSQDHAQNNLKKAKNFAQAHLPGQLGLTTASKTFDSQKDIEMVQHFVEQIQQTSGAFLTLIPEHGKMTFCGVEEDVSSAQSLVDMVLKNFPEKQITSEMLDDAGKHKVFQALLSQQWNLPNHQSLKPEGVMQIKEKIVQSDEDLVKKLESHSLSAKPPDGYDGNEDIAEECQGIPMDQNIPFKRYSDKIDKTTTPDSSACSSDVEDEHKGALDDAESEKKIQQAVKLGYPENQVRLALLKLGYGCDLNELLSELIRTDGEGDLQSGGLSASPEMSTAGAGHFLDAQLNAYLKSNPSRDNSKLNEVLRTEDQENEEEHEDLSGSNNLRHIIIDGSNVAMSHGKKVFSCTGIQIAVDWFRDRGHTNITAFVPQWRKETSRPDAPITDQDILMDLEKEGVLVFTPSRRVKGRRIVCYDDRYILRLAVDTDGIVVSNDVYRDLVKESEDFRTVVDHRLLMYTFVNDRFMPPEDPLGRLGPSLDNFLRKKPLEPAQRPQDCPYGRKCTYGNKCRYYHPERGLAPQKSITETLKEQAEVRLQEMAAKKEDSEKGKRPKQKLARTRSLIPGEPFPSGLSSLPLEHTAVQEKPKLSHSLSHGYSPRKNSDYLAEPRKKFHEAILTEGFSSRRSSTPVSQRDAIKQSQRPKELFSSTDSHRPQSSPVPSVDFVKQSVTAASSFPSASASAPSLSQRSLTPMSARLSPTHLMVPKQEETVKYVSGHLQLANKLSDDREEFFDRPVVPASSSSSSSPTNAMKQTDHSFVDFIQGEQAAELRRQDVIGSSSFHSQMLPGLSQEEELVQYSTSGQIPNFSIFQSPLSFPSSTQSANSTDSFHTGFINHGGSESTAEMRMLPNVSAPSQTLDSGTYSVGESSLSPDQMLRQNQPPGMQEILSGNMPPQFQKSALSQVDQSSYDRHSLNMSHANLRRTSSATVDNEFSIKPKVKPLLKRSGEHSPLKPQQSMPVHLVPQQVQPVQPPLYALSRQNSNSDPQLHYSADVESDDQSGRFLSAEGNTMNISGKVGHRMQNNTEEAHPQMVTKAQTQGKAINVQQKLTLEQHQMELSRFQEQQMAWSRQQQQLLNTGGFQCQGSRPVLGNTHPEHQVYFTNPPPAYPQQHPQYYHPLQQQQYQAMPTLSNTFHVPAMTMRPPPSPASPSPVPNFYTPVNSINMSSGTHPAVYSPVSMHPGHHSANPPQHFQQVPSYPPFGKVMATQLPQAHPEATFRRCSESPQYGRLDIQPEEALILPSDPRYSTYFHLSYLFEERVVRKVMNRNPGVVNPADLCTLINSHLEERKLQEP